MGLDEEKEKPVSGPVCEYCGKSSNSLYLCFIKRIRRGYAEMVKIYLCAYHFFQQLECDTKEPELPPPPDDEEDIDAFEFPDEKNEEGDDEENW